MPYEYDFSWRPGDYLEALSPTERMLAGIQGANRRRIVESMIAEGAVDELDERLCSGALTSAEILAWGGRGPTNLGGECLPPMLKNEVEIARVTLASTTQDVISIRAQKVSYGWKYRVVDEYCAMGEIAAIVCRPKSTRLPLAFERIVSLINTTVDSEYEYPGLVVGMLQHHVRNWKHEPELKIGFITVSSYYYSEMAAYYDDVIAECLLRLSIEDNDGDPHEAGSGGETREPRRLDSRFFEVLSEEQERAVQDAMAALRETGDVLYEEYILNAMETLKTTCKGLR